jgi:hypothetical protein
MTNLPATALDRVRARARRVLSVAGDRYVIDLPPDARPEELLRELTAAGAALVSLNPVRETLEDVFIRRVAEMGDGARPDDRQGAGHASGTGSGPAAGERARESGGRSPSVKP